MSKKLEVLMNRARQAQMWDAGAHLRAIDSKAAIHMAVERAQFLADLLAEIVQQYDREK